MRVLVTGGAGFLGSHLVDRLLEEQHEVIALDNLFTGQANNLWSARRSPLFTHCWADVCQPLPTFGVDRIYHLACPAAPVHYQRSPADTIATCVVGTKNVLDLAHRIGARVLLASTSEVYGDPAEHPQTEAYWGRVNPIGPRACYDEGKRCAEALATSYARQHGVKVRIARIFNTYGPRMRSDDGRVVSNFIVQALRGEPLTIYGDGSQTRSFCYVSDTIDGLVRLMESVQPGPVNIGNPEEQTMLELARTVLALSGSQSILVERPLPTDDPARRRPNIDRAWESLGWSPRVPIANGLRETIDYFRGRQG